MCERKPSARIRSRMAKINPARLLRLGRGMYALAQVIERDVEALCVQLANGADGVFQILSGDEPPGHAPPQ